CTLTDMIEHSGRYIAGHYTATRPHASGCLDGLVPSTTSQIQNTHAGTDAGHMDKRVSRDRQASRKFIFPLCPAGCSLFPSAAQFRFRWGLGCSGNWIFASHELPGRRLPPHTQTERTVTLSCVVDYLFGRIVDDDWRLEILEFRLRAKDRLDSLFKGRAVRLLRSLDILPEVNTTTAPGFFIEQKRLVDEVRVGLPHRHASAVFGHGVCAAHFVGQTK